MLRAEATPGTTTDANSKARLTFGTWESCITIGTGNGKEDEFGNIQVNLVCGRWERGTALLTLSPKRDSRQPEFSCCQASRRNMTVVRGAALEPDGIAGTGLGETVTWYGFAPATIAEEFEGNVAFDLRHKSGGRLRRCPNCRTKRKCRYLRTSHSGFLLVHESN